jgi:hypothetical protein
VNNKTIFVIINKTEVLLPRAQVTLVDFGYPLYALWFYCSQSFKLFDFPFFDFERTWCWLFQNAFCILNLIYTFLFGSSSPVVCRMEGSWFFFAIFVFFAYRDVQHFVLSYVCTFWVSCCDVHCEFCINRCSVCLYIQLFVVVFTLFVENTEWKIKNGQCRVTGNTGYTRHNAKTNQIKNTTQYVLDTTISKQWFGLVYGV